MAKDSDTLGIVTGLGICRKGCRMRGGGKINVEVHSRTTSARQLHEAKSLCLLARVTSVALKAHGNWVNVLISLRVSYSFTPTLRKQH